MSETVNIEIIGYSRSELAKTINTEFSELITPTTTSATTTPLPTVSEFFQYYQDLFFQIPKNGETNSHEYLVKTSGEYIGGAQTNEDILALQKEITQLRQDNLEFQQSLINLQPVTGSQP
jgi:hypothetical protein